MYKRGKLYKVGEVLAATIILCNWEGERCHDMPLPTPFPADFHLDFLGWIQVTSLLIDVGKLGGMFIRLSLNNHALG